MFRTLLIVMVIAFGSFQSTAEVIVPDTSAAGKKSLKEFLMGGKLDIHTRTFWMSTINRGELLDYSTAAFGAGLGYHTPEWKGFQAGFSGFFTFQLYEHNLRLADPTTGNVNRYEILLYDMNDVDNTNDLDRLEDLYLAYRYKNLRAVFGRQTVNSPLLNEQDNRMRPNHFSGLSVYYTGGEWELTGGWYTHATMRGTVDWYSVESSFGVYPFGRNPMGVPSQYRDNISSKGIGLLGVKWKPLSTASLQVWNYSAENVFNLTFAQADANFGKGSWFAVTGLQGFYQLPVHNGGNSDLMKSYIGHDETSLGVGARAGLSNRKHTLTVNMLRVDARGRFLFPREWGREIFYASLPRERFEGSGDLWALNLRYEQSLMQEKLKTMFAVGTTRMPSVNNFVHNKYGVPSYYHVAASVGYHFHGYLEGLELMFLAVNKTAQNPDSVEDIYRINRVDMWNLNAVINYHF